MPADVLDVRTREAFDARPTLRAANIPLADLAQRPFELAAPDVPVLVADTGPEAYAAAEVLDGMGRVPQIVPSRSGAPDGSRYRLWTTTSLLDAAFERPPGRALCAACGAGREAVVLAAGGWDVVAVDILPDAIERGRLLERGYAPAGAPTIRWLVADIRQPLPSEIERFDLVTQLFYADAATPTRLARHLAERGIALLEAFSGEHCRRLGRSRAEAVLRRDAFSALRVELYDEGWHEGRHTTRLVLGNEAEAG